MLPARAESPIPVAGLPNAGPRSQRGRIAHPLRRQRAAITWPAPSPAIGETVKEGLDRMGRSGKGHARSRDCDEGWLEPMESPQQSRSARLMAGLAGAVRQRSANGCIDRLADRPLTSPQSTQTQPCCNCEKYEGKSGRSGRRDGGRGSIEISGHWPSRRPTLLWHRSSYRG